METALFELLSKELVLIVGRHKEKPYEILKSIC